MKKRPKKGKLILPTWKKVFTLRCLIVEDEKIQRMALRGLLKGWEITEAETLSAAKKALKNNYFDIAFFDLDLDKKLAGLQLTKIAKEEGIYSVVITGHQETKITEQAYNAGCKDYLVKPITQKSLELVLNSFSNFESESRINNLIRTKYITKDEKTLSELNIIKKVGLSDRPILIKGPSGTGKRIVAHIIKDALKVPDDKFVELNCAQFAETLFESELFGYKKGAFTGATEDKTGLLAKADNGIIFLDEIHSLSKSAQQKLMKAIEERVFYPVGSSKPVRSNFRVICATCENLIEMVADHKFRPDFYARINRFQIELFALKDRPHDILPLIEFATSKFSRKIVITDLAKAELLKLDWKNNTRDIEGIVDHWHIQGYGIIGKDEIPEQFKHQIVEDKISPISKNDIRIIKKIGLNAYLDAYKKKIIETFYELESGHQGEVARILGVTRQTVRNIMKEDQQNPVIMAKQEGQHEQVVH